MRPVAAARRLVRAVALVVAATAWFTPAPAFAAGDFTLLVSPASQLLPPGGAVAYAVEVGAIGGFADPVQLSVGSLPAGVTSVLSETTVTPPATVSLTLSATQDAALGDFSLLVTGTSGGLTHTTSGSATVNFGLVPICDGHIRGTVTDEETGEPIEGANVNGELTDADGHWGPIDVRLGENNSPVPVFVLARKDGYWNSFAQSDPVLCGQTTVANLTLLEWQPADITGHVVLGMPDPADPEKTLVDPAGGPLEGASVFVTVGLGSSAADVSDEDGAFALHLPFLGFRNTGLTFVVGADFAGYWPPKSGTAGEINPGETVDIVIPMVPVCTGSLSAVVRFADTNALAEGVTVTAASGTDRQEAVTDAAGRVDFAALRLGFNNQATDYSLFTDAPDDYHTGSAETGLTGCDDHQDVEILLQPDAFGSMEGLVLDEETGNPVEGVNVGFSCARCDFSEAITDAAGHYRISHIPADPPPSSWIVRASHVDYWPASDTADVNPGETTRLDFVILRVRHASVSGVIRDSVTGDPLPDAGVAGGGGTVHADADGAYAIAPLPLGDRNSPGAASLTAGSPGYWPQSKTILYSADEAVVLDFELLKVCDGATIRGHVVDFVTGLPIEDAQVSTSAGGVDLTNADGEFVLTTVAVGNNNSPNEVTVSVSAKGYFPQSRQVTVFCGAHFQLDFAPPTPTSSLEGTVTNAVTGDPIAGVTVIGEWGDQTQTDADGDYAFTTVPLQADGSDHAWEVSALTDECGQATKSFTAHAGTTARVDFAFCERDEEDHPAISLEKSGTFAAGANTLADPGETIAYSLVVANTGDVDVHGVSVTDGKLATVTCPASTVPVGGSITCTGSYAVTQQDIDAGSVHNTASADSDETGSTESSTTVTLPVRAALHLDKLADRQTFAAAGVVIDYTFTLTNSGNVTLAGPFTVADDQAINEACPATPATLAPGASVSCTASDTTTQQDLNSGALVNTATARATFGAAAVTSNQATATVTATQRPALTLVKTATPTTFAAAGQVIAYTYVATNSGNVTLAAPYGVADDRSTDEHCPSTPATLAPGASVTCAATYTITAGDATAGSVTNRATATARFGAQTVTSNEATATVTRTAPGAQLLPTQTTCQQYRAGATSLTEALYNPQKGKIGSVAPGVMFFYDTISVAAGTAPVTLSVTQARSPSLSGWTPIPVQDVGQIVLYDQATCLKSKAQGSTTYSASTGTATVRVTAPGTYILGIKYSLSSLEGIPVSSPSPTVAYTFGRNGGTTTASISIRPKK